MTTSITPEALQPLLAGMEANGTLRSWDLRHRTSRSLQRLYASPDNRTLSCHQDRSVDETSISLTVYTPGADSGTVGTATVDIVPFKPLHEQLAETVALARCSANPAWDLPGAPDVPPAPVETCDPRIRDDAAGVAAEIEQRFAAAFAPHMECALNSGELFLNYKSTMVLNSAGLSFTVERSDLYLEAAMERAGQENDKEVHEYDTSVATADLDVEDFVEQCALQVASLGDSTEPESSTGATVLIHKRAIAQLLDAVQMQLGCAFEYNKYPFIEKGTVLGGGGDSLTVTLDASLPCMALSGTYTGDGLPTRTGTIIKDNTVTERTVDNRYGQYLERTPNGLAGNMLVNTGTLTPADLTGTAYLDIIKFSSLLVDERKLTWSSEIKLGRLIAADGTESLVKGGVVSGNIRENLNGCRFSTDEGTLNFPGNSFESPLGYRGPESMLITNGVSIAGTEGGAS